jgi:Ca2+-binding RTX toxin-like protein
VRRLLAAPAVIAALTVPQAAHASTIESSASTGPQSTAYIDYQAANGERNRLRVHSNRDGSVTFTDGGVRRIEVLAGLGPDCKSRDRRRVVCASGGDPVYVSLGDRDDKVVFSPHGTHADPRRTDPRELAEDQDYYADDDEEGALDFTSEIDAGGGDDVIIASSGADYIFSGRGRDAVRGQGGRDFVGVSPDRSHDDLRGGGGIDALAYRGRGPVRMDMRAGSVGVRGEHDAIGGFERVHGTSRDDTLLGTDGADAIYGEGGSDTIDGRGGNDLLTADGLARRSHAFANRIMGGPGNDLVDARGNELVPTNAIDCGVGADVVASETDDLLAPSCESSTFGGSDPGSLFSDEPSFGFGVPTRPVAADADGTLSFRIRCPRDAGGRCKGQIALSSPPGTASTSYGSGTFDLKAGGSLDVRIAGSSAAPRSEPVAVHVNGKPGIDFGWQLVLEPPG